MEKQLFKSKDNRLVVGVCGGLAEYFRIDPTIVRLIWIALSFTGGAGIIAYIFAAIIIPEKRGHYKNSGLGKDEQEFQETFNPGTNDWGKPAEKFDTDKNKALLGGILVILGVFFLTREFFSWFSFKYFWPIIIIAMGALLVYKGRRN